jgi:hypothetical protein
MPPAGYRKVSERDAAIMHRMHAEGDGIRRIARITGYAGSTVSRQVFKKSVAKKKGGRPKAWISTPAGFKAAEKAYQKLLRDSKGLKEITAEMLRKHMKLKCSVKALRRAFWENGVRFRPLFEKPDLTDADKAERRAWAESHKHRTAAGWSRYVHAVIDNKTFPVYTAGKHRDMVARRQIRGAYRNRSRQYGVGYVRPPNPKALKTNTGSKSATVACAIGNGKVLMWHVIPGAWTGAAARAMYEGPLRAALEKEYTDVRGPWRVLEDNDPTGHLLSSSFGFCYAPADLSRFDQSSRIDHGDRLLSM